MAYVADPVAKGTIPLHMLWDSFTLRSTTLEDVDRHARDSIEKLPRSTMTELKIHPRTDDFLSWAKDESFQLAENFAYGYGIETAQDPNKDMDSDRLLRNMIRFVLEGVSPVEKAPEVPAEYREKLQQFAARRVTLAGYRLADLVIAAADRVAAQKGETQRQ